MGKILLMILLLWGKNSNTNFQKCSQVFVLICHCGGTCLIRILCSKNSTVGLILDYHGKKIVTVGKFLEYSTFSKCSLMFVFVCHCGCTSLIKILHPQYST